MNPDILINIFIVLTLLWSVLWKGLALWRAAKLGQRNWFIVMLVINLYGVLEIVYLFRFAKKRMTLQELKTIFKEAFTPPAKSK